MLFGDLHPWLKVWTQNGWITMDVRSALQTKIPRSHSEIRRIVVVLGLLRTSNWCVAQESNLVISIRYETDFDWALPISEPRKRILPQNSLKAINIRHIQY
jgi:hypothetical protein